MNVPLLSENKPKEILRKDYKKPDFLIENVNLTVQIYDGKTTVDSTIWVKSQQNHLESLQLDGKNLSICSLEIDGMPLLSKDYTYDNEQLILYHLPKNNTFKIRSVVEIEPEKNTSLMGLYTSSTLYCTQCESEGFRKITFFKDRPDILSKYTVRIESDKKTCPVLLSNGNMIESGDLPNNRHYTIWEDPFYKPCYLFALVAGDLDHIEDSFTTISGRHVELKIYTEKGDTGKCLFAMESLKKAMKWDEEKYGREYDLDIFNIVAVSDFNFGAMENKSLNIFNTSTLFASQETATDNDFLRVEAVVAHEYFHNWSGNRVTCRDWFQLSLKEGLTVFREQSFSGDMNSNAVQRIDDVNLLKTIQFKEDAGPMAHPIRPESYIEIDNFYTMTVYEKGSEVIRMLHTILGDERYRKATDLYFERHDGQAATCEDFVKAMEDASGLDLTQFRLWYSQAGTPLVDVSSSYDPNQKIYTLNLKQTIPDTPGQKNKQAMHIPVLMGLIDSSGQEIKLNKDGDRSVLLNFTQNEQTFTFDNIHSKPTPSLFRQFSAPIKMNSDLSEEDLLHLMRYDSDGFNRWESKQTLATRLFLSLVNHHKRTGEFSHNGQFIGALKYIIDHLADDKTLLAKSLALPSLSYLIQQMDTNDVELAYKARKYMIEEIARTYQSNFKELYHLNETKEPYKTDPISIGKRAVRNLSLSYLASLKGEDIIALTSKQYHESSNMTDRAAALSILADFDHELSRKAYKDFYINFADEDLVIDKWFSMQAYADRPDCFQIVQSLLQHEAFRWTNPNRLRALLGAFASNIYRFHAEDGSGYQLIADAVIKLNTINPSVGARLAGTMLEWRRYDSQRQMKMKEQLERILLEKNLSKNIFEIVSKALK